MTASKSVSPKRRYREIIAAAVVAVVVAATHAEPKEPPAQAGQAVKAAKDSQSERSNPAPVQTDKFANELARVNSRLESIDRQLKRRNESSGTDYAKQAFDQTMEIKQQLRFLGLLAGLMVMFLSIVIFGSTVLLFSRTRRTHLAVRQFQEMTMSRLNRLQAMEYAINRLQARGSEEPVETNEARQQNESSNDQRRLDEGVQKRGRKFSDSRPAHSGSAPFRYRKPQIAVDESLLMQIGAECLQFPLSVDEFRRKWRERGGQEEVEISGYPDNYDPVVILADNRDGETLGVPNTTDWARLSQTELFEHEGMVGPATRVHELLDVARLTNSRKGLQSDQAGRVRVGI
jgi:hypothetical protein